MLAIPPPGRRTELVDRYRQVVDSWWPWLNAMIQRVRENTGAVVEIIDQIGARWALTVNVNNRVVGAVTIDGSTSEPTVAFLADKFEIVHPSDDGTTIQAFVVGTINGVAGVGINGDLFVDQTILARSLNVTELSAVAANVGTATAGFIRSSDSKVVLDLDNGIFSITT